MKNSGFYKWALLALLSGAFFFHQADRALFGLLTVPIQDELGLTSVQIGWINTVLSWTLAGMAFIAGPIGDRFSRKWLITCSLIAWSLMTFMMGFVGDWRVCGFVIPAFFVVMFFRSIATGVGESFYGPCYPPLIAAYHKETRSIALSIQQGSLYVGLMTCGILSAWALVVLGSWRHVFMAFGAAGFSSVAYRFIADSVQTSPRFTRMRKTSVATASTRISAPAAVLNTWLCAPISCVGSFHPAQAAAAVIAAAKAIVIEMLARISSLLVLPHSKRDPPI